MADLESVALLDYLYHVYRNDAMCMGFDEVCDSAYSNCQWCNQTDSANDDIGFCDLGKYSISKS